MEILNVLYKQTQYDRKSKAQESTAHQKFIFFLMDDIVQYRLEHRRPHQAARNIRPIARFPAQVPKAKEGFSNAERKKRREGRKENLKSTP